jgi:hypothetical protein
VNSADHACYHDTCLETISSLVKLVLQGIALDEETSSEIDVEEPEIEFF